MIRPHLVIIDINQTPPPPSVCANFDTDNCAEQYNSQTVLKYFMFKSMIYTEVRVLSRNLPADSIHSGFLNSHVHCLSQYPDNLCSTILVQLSTKSYQFSVTIVPDNVGSICRRIWNFKLLLVHLLFSHQHKTWCSCATETAKTRK